MPEQAPWYDNSTGQWSTRDRYSKPADPVPGQNTYVDETGVTRDMNSPENTDPRGPAYREQTALADPNSTASRNLYYGQDPNAVSREMLDRRSAGVQAGQRVAPTLNQAQMGQSRGMAMGLADRFAQSAAGDPNSLAQQQLQRGYAATGANLMSGAASTRGGHLAGALARRTANNMVAGNVANQAVQSRDLMAREQMNAYGQQTGLGAAMRATDQDAAFAQSDDAMRMRGINDAQQQRQEGMRTSIGSLGMQGQKNRIDNLGNHNISLLGGSAESARMAFDSQNRATDTIMGGGKAAFDAGARLGQRYGMGNATDPDDPRRNGRG